MSACWHRFCKNGLPQDCTSFIAAELESGQLVRPINIASKSQLAYYFVAPARYFELPKVALFRTWLEECCCAFPAPEG